MSFYTVIIVFWMVNLSPAVILICSYLYQRKIKFDSLSKSVTLNLLSLNGNNIFCKTYVIVWILVLS